MANIYKFEQELTYVGKGFFGYDKSNSKVIYLRKVGQFDSLVTYMGKELLVRNYEIQ
jgi:hypothetical protein